MADDPRFDALAEAIVPGHRRPIDLLPGARSVASFFVPFAEGVVRANRRGESEVAREWAVAYTETNRLIEDITAELVAGLAECGVRAAAEPPTGRFDRQRLVSSWSHKSVGVMAGLGSFGLNRMVITDAGCAGRFGSVVLDCDAGAPGEEVSERCLYLASGECLECVRRCPVGALREDGGFDRALCWARCKQEAVPSMSSGRAEVCGKCAVGPCAIRDPSTA